MTPGQSLALEQIRRIAEQGDALRVLTVAPPSETTSTLRVEISLYCKDMPRVAQGLPIRDRERMYLLIGEQYPYDYPVVMVTHRRFAGYPHVGWVFFPCLYQAPQTEWSPSGGMPSFLTRLELWLRMAALDQLDPIGGAMHPPITSNQRGPLLVPRVDTPAVGAKPWLGLAELVAASEQRLDLTGWKSLDAQTGSLVAAAILLDRPMPLEYPEKLGSLLMCLESRGVSIDELLAILRSLLQRNSPEQPLYVVLGTPMRGTRGGAPRQHLACWRVDAFAGDIAKLDGRIAELEQRTATAGADELSREVSELRADVRNNFLEWAKDLSLAWCQIREDRPEVTLRRDSGRPAEAFRGLSIEVWGCGALGANIADWVVRAGARRIVVRDEGHVSPGILVRQPYTDADIGRAKAEVLAERLRLVAPKCEIEGIVGDILEGPLGNNGMGEVDLIIDATASNLVLTRIEELWKSNPSSRRRMASVAIDRAAEKLIGMLVTSEHSGGPFDASRRMKVVACGEPRLKPYLEAFFPDEPQPAFQPEPGCSDATFVGSGADCALLAAIATNLIGTALGTPDPSARGFFAASPASAQPAPAHFVCELDTDVVFNDPQTGYETRIDRGAWNSIAAWKEESFRKRGLDVETGGLLFGEMNEHLRVIWVSEASGPPPDSQHSAQEFVCGIEGTRELSAEKTRRTRNAVQYVGTWHTHPVSEPVPSGRDFGAMDLLLTASPTPVERLLLLILGVLDGKPAATANVFLRKEFESLRARGFMERGFLVARVPPQATTSKPRIGVALSGGGSRAMAFHLGCLRALNDRGLLGQVEVLSTVSGGSVIGAMYAYSNDPFIEFEGRVRAALRRGFVWGIGRRTLLSPLLLQIFGTQASSGIAAKLAFAARFVIGQCESLIPRKSKARGLFAQGIQPPWRRWTSRTDAFERTLSDYLFANLSVTSPRRGNIEVVMNACELRTGTAFRFGSRESGSWRFGTIRDNRVDLATAVAASAAYPALLPAIDRYFNFVERNGDESRKRAILTDGGVYENLGITCMTPDRDDNYSTNVFRPPYIICCDAGPGQFDDVVLPYGWTSRMRRSFETTFRQTQHGLQQQIHLWRRYGAIEGFVYAYLGQQDRSLPVQLPGLVKREEVVHYPTDFSPMSDTDIELLSRRGEQLTRLLVEQYCPRL